MPKTQRSAFSGERPGLPGRSNDLKAPSVFRPGCLSSSLFAQSYAHKSQESHPAPASLSLVTEEGYSSLKNTENTIAVLPSGQTGGGLVGGTSRFTIFRIAAGSD